MSSHDTTYTTSSYHHRDHFSATSSTSSALVSWSRRPRRLFPQSACAALGPLRGDPSSVVVRAALSFPICAGPTRLRPRLRVAPAHKEDGTASKVLTGRVAEFLVRSDHVAQEWRKMLSAAGRTEESYSRMSKNLVRSRGSDIDRTLSNSSIDSLPSCSEVERPLSSCSEIDRTLSSYSELDHKLPNDSDEDRRLPNGVKVERLVPIRYENDQSLSSCSELDHKLPNSYEKRRMISNGVNNERIIPITYENDRSLSSYSEVDRKLPRDSYEEGMIRNGFKVERLIPISYDYDRSLSSCSEFDPKLGNGCEIEELSEMSADLADERAAAQLAAQRLDAETAHRARLERELADTQARESKLSAAGARLEAELLAVRADDAVVDADGDDDEAGAETLRARLARAGRELALLRHRLTQQHADDLEQLVALKKQMEKKLADVYEDVNAQRQTAAQAQRKAQKLSSESNDLRLHLEEQAARNALLEKKQRRFDAELQAALESARTEKRERERAARERDLALAEKTALEQSLSATQLEVQLREDQAAALTRELDAAAAGGHSELELASLRRTRHELESKLQEQEDELDDLAGQLAMLGQAKLRLEMSLEQQRKEARREQAQRDEELDEARGNASKKVKALEAALEGEHEERTRLLRDKHELERRANDALAQASRSHEEQEQALRMRKELKRTRALLKDAQQALAAQQDAPNKALLRQLRHQLEDAEAARAAAARGRQGAEAELAELRAQLDEAARARQDAESRANAATREKQELRAQLDENEEELSEVLKKYGLTVSALSVAQAASAESAASAAALEAELRAQRDAAAELQARLDAAGADPECSLAQRRLELRVREAESRLELEQTTRGRLEVQISRLKEAVGRATSEAVTARGREAEAEGAARRASRQLREAREAAAAAAARDSEAAARRKDAEQRLEAAAAETAALRQELRAALARVADLQQAMQDECSLSDSGPESDSDESIESFLIGHDASERDGSERDGSEAPSQGSTEQRLGLDDSLHESFA